MCYSSSAFAQVQVICLLKYLKYFSKLSLRSSATARAATIFIIQKHKEKNPIELIIKNAYLFILSLPAVAQFKYPFVNGKCQTKIDASRQSNEPHLNSNKMILSSKWAFASIFIFCYFRPLHSPSESISHRVAVIISSHTLFIIYEVKLIVLFIFNASACSAARLLDCFVTQLKSNVWWVSRKQANSKDWRIKYDQKEEKEKKRFL